MSMMNAVLQQTLVLECRLKELETQSAVFQQQVLDINQLIQQTNEMLRRINVANCAENDENHTTSDTNKKHTPVQKLICELVYNNTTILATSLAMQPGAGISQQSTTGHFDV